MNAKPILAYDCATAGASIALRIDQQTFTRTIPQEAQAAALVSTMDDLLKKHDIAYADLGCIVTTIGPGSFTGVRIGLAALHGLVLVTKVPIKLLSTLDAAAWTVLQSNPEISTFIVGLRAGKGEQYTQTFAIKNNQPVATHDITLEPEERTNWPLPYFTHVPKAARMAEVADRLPSASLTDALPLYIRPPDAALPAPYPWLTPK